MEGGDDPQIPWGMDPSELAPGALRTINQDKLDLFTKGVKRKTTGKKKSDDDTLKVFEDFVSSFDVDAKRKGFVMAGTLVPGHKSMSKTVVGNEFAFPDTEKPKISSSKQDDKKKKKRGMENLVEELRREQEDRERYSGSSSSATASTATPQAPAPTTPFPLSPSRGMAVGMPSISPARPPHMPGVVTFGADLVDDGDPTSTNLYVGNLNPQITEEDLLREFGFFGEVASVKIMWPRTEEEHRRNRNCGFVAFMERGPASMAKNSMNNKVLMGYEIRVGWGKAVPKPAHALNPGGGVPQQLLDKAKEQELAQAAIAARKALGLPALAPEAAALIPTLTQQPTEVPGESAPKPPEAPVLSGIIPAGHQQIKIVMPETSERRSFVDRVARYVAREKYEFEQVLLRQECNNPRFYFLRHIPPPVEDLPFADPEMQTIFNEHHYYMWRVWSLSNGDSLHKWRDAPFQMTSNGPYFIPPRSEEHERERERARKLVQQRAEDLQTFKPGERPLAPQDAETYENMLKALTVARQHIASAMVFALDHADSAKEIIEITAESLSLVQTSVPLKIARLYLISDILHNSSAAVRNASFYRTGFQECLLQIFKHIHNTHTNLDSLIIRKAMQERVLTVLNTWERWSLYPPEFTTQLRCMFVTGFPFPAGLAPITSNDTPQAVDEDLDGEAMDDIDGIPLDDNTPIFGQRLV